MPKEKQVTKKDIQQLLNNQTKIILNVVDDKIDNLAILVKNAFQGNQEYMDKRFDNLTGEMRGGFKQVTEKINNLSKNTVDVIHQEAFDKLESRVIDLEEIAQLPVKKS